jgi:hypothetical protein
MAGTDERPAAIMSRMVGTHRPQRGAASQALKTEETVVAPSPTTRFTERQFTALQTQTYMGVGSGSLASPAI